MTLNSPHFLKQQSLYICIVGGITLETCLTLKLDGRKLSDLRSGHFIPKINTRYEVLWSPRSSVDTEEKKYQLLLPDIEPEI
jgi:hypothetical protein